MKLLIIDNYDSFTYNLVHLVSKCSDVPFVVKRNDEVLIDEISVYDKILLSPGPGLPGDAGLLVDIIKRYKESKSIFGVCLGQQAIGEVFGGRLKNLSQVYHGVSTPIQILKEDSLFKDCPTEFRVGRYHSWIIDEVNFPSELEVLASDQEHNIMAIRHRWLDVKGVQFHPESVLSEYGETIIRNWLTN